MQKMRTAELPDELVIDLPPLLKSISGPDLSFVDASQINEILSDRDFYPNDAEKRIQDLYTIKQDCYKSFFLAWRFGSDLFEWAQDCQKRMSEHQIMGQYFFEALWPHKQLTSFFELVLEKGWVLEKDLADAVGAQLIFRQLPPIDSFTLKYLSLLWSKQTRMAYEQWRKNEGLLHIQLPPERFRFEIVAKEVALNSRLERLV